MRWSVTILLLVAASAYGHGPKPTNKHKHDFHIVKNSIDLNAVTFDKIRRLSPVMASLFLPHVRVGALTAEYKEFARDTKTQSKVLATTVGVSEEHDENWQIAQRYNLTMDDLPVFMVFVDGELHADIRGSELREMHCDEIREFVSEKSGVWIGKEGNLELYDELASKFIRTSEKEEREQLLQETKILALEAHDLVLAEFYIYVMEGILEKGYDEFMKLDIRRVDANLGLNKDKGPIRTGFIHQRNILRSFQKVKGHTPHES